MKTTLLFPPSWHPSQPYLSLPALTGFLRREGVDVIQRDINIEFLEVILNKDNQGDFLERIGNRLTKRSFTGEKEDYSKLISALEEIPVVARTLDSAKAALRGEGFYDSNQ
ncbi:MAG: B12-binding domain-containing radical SAM protein, partial [Deltaproteobacteria bacterium]